MRIAPLLIVLGACGQGVPSQPTYFADIQPILRANCARCHGADPADERIANYRLDRYVKDDTFTYDVWDYAQASADQVAPMMRVAVYHESPMMPPDYPLSDRQRDTLEAWLQAGAPKGTRENHTPRVELVAPLGAATADQTLDVEVFASDEDLDGLVVQLWAHDTATSPDTDVPLGKSFGAGRRKLAVDTGTLASRHTFEIYAIADDGFHDDPAQNRVRATLLERLTVDHGARGTAPTVRLVMPNGGETLFGTVPIEWIASDPDVGDDLVIDLDLVSVASDGTETVVAAIAADLPNSPSTFSWTIPGTIPTSNGAGPIAYRVRVTATDTLGQPMNVRSDSSDATFSIQRSTTTTYTWDDVKPTFVQFCGKCHSQPARTMAIENFRLDKYDASDPGDVNPNNDPGVYEMRAKVYERMINIGNMPPAAEPKPSAAQKDMVANWILGGAPKGSGPADPMPTFAWTSPTGPVTGGSAMLAWTAMDDGGLATGKIEYLKVTGGNPNVPCPSSLNTRTDWATVPDPKADVALAGATSWTDALTWSVPNSAGGWFCVRGVVSDAVNPTPTQVINQSSIK